MPMSDHHDNKLKRWQFQAALTHAIEYAHVDEQCDGVLSHDDIDAMEDELMTEMNKWRREVERGRNFVG